MNQVNRMPPSPRQPLNWQGVLRFPGQGQNTLITTAYGIGQRKSEQRLKLGRINVATLKRKEEELVELMKMRDLYILALAETRLNGKGERTIHKNYRLRYSGGEDSRYGVGFLVWKIWPLMFKR